MEAKTMRRFALVLGLTGFALVASAGEPVVAGNRHHSDRLTGLRLEEWCDSTKVQSSHEDGREFRK
ncbi:MAG: hypothetical protein ABGY42_00005 [bacterium]